MSKRRIQRFRGSENCISRLSLTNTEARAFRRVLREEGVSLPKVGWCKKALGGEICRHPKYTGRNPRAASGDSGLQVICVRRIS